MDSSGKKSTRSCTWGINKIIPILIDLKVDWTVGRNMCLYYNDGCQVKITDDITLSIQTHPDITGCALIETAYIINGKVDPNSVIKYMDIEEIKRDIADLIDKQTLACQLRKEYKEYIKNGTIKMSEYALLGREFVWFLSENKEEILKYIKQGNYTGQVMLFSEHDTSGSICLTDSF